MDVLRRSEGEVELETTGAVATARRSRGSRSRGSRPDRAIVVITTTALQLEDERPEERRQGEGLQQLHRFEKARAEEVRTRAEALHSSFCHRVPPR